VIQIARDNLRTQERLVTLAERQQRVGTATELDVNQLRTLMEQTRSSIPAIQITQGQANDRLCVLLGEPPHDLEPEFGPAREPGKVAIPTPSTVAAGVPADLLRRRPDVRSAERQVAAQNPQIGVAEAELYPSVSIGTQLGHVDVALGPALAANGFLGLITPQFNWNILNYGRLVNNVHFQDARTQELVAAYQYKVLTAAQEVQTSLRGFLRSQEQSESLVRSVIAAMAATKVQERLFTDIKADVNRLFTLENTQLQVQDQLAVAQGDIALNLVGVYRALGGGWELRCQPDACRPGPTAEPPAAPLAEPSPTPEQIPPPKPRPETLPNLPEGGNRTGEPRP
jgi:outer membrane protein TolC